MNVYDFYCVREYANGSGEVPPSTQIEKKVPHNLHSRTQ